MRPLKLTLKGFIGIYTGQGRDELVVDLESIGADARLVALRGPNGAGKSTVLDNLHPYRTMPSRTGGDPFGSFSYYEHVRLPENLKELEWEHDGRRYKSSLVIRVNGKRKTEAYLQVLEAGRWAPVKLDDGTVCDGKTDVYDRCLEAIVGSPETFFTSVFSAQKRRALADYRNGEIKTLMTDLLGLNEVRQTGSQAAEVAKQLKTGLASMRSDDAALAERIQAVAKEGAQLADCESRLGEAVEARVKAGQTVADAQAALAQLQAREVIAREADGERARLRAELARCETEASAALKDLDAVRARDRTQLQTLRTGIETRQRHRAAAVTAAMQQLAAATKITSQAEAIEKAVGSQPRLAALVERCEDRAAAARARVATARDLEAQLTAVDREIASIEREAGAAELRSRDLRKRLALTTEVPCAGSDLQDKCRLLTNATEARPLIPSADATVERLRAARAEALAQRCRTGTALGGLRGCADQLRRAEARLSALRASHRSAELLAARLGELDAARAASVSAELALRDAEALPDADPTELAAIDTLERSIASHDARGARIRADAEERKAALGRAIAAIAPGPTAEDLRLATQRLDEARGRQERCQDAVGAAIARRTSAEAAAVEAARLQTEAMQRAARQRKLEDEIGLWSLLAEALSNNGVIALAIDDAGPALSQIANELLSACYGPRFSVSIRTQIESAKGDLREGFDVVVFDGNTGDSKSVSMMSGGESVWINEALTRAIALYLARVTGRRFSTLFCDEVDGPLDAEHKRHFMAMKRQVLDLGGYEREYFVSQTPELAAMADDVIDLGASVEETA